MILLTVRTFPFSENELTPANVGSRLCFWTKHDHVNVEDCFNFGMVTLLRQAGVGIDNDVVSSSSTYDLTFPWQENWRSWCWLTGHMMNCFHSMPLNHWEVWFGFTDKIVTLRWIAPFSIARMIMHFQIRISWENIAQPLSSLVSAQVSTIVAATISRCHHRPLIDSTDLLHHRLGTGWGLDSPSPPR